MSETIKFLIYSDIHYDRLGARCVTLEDCENIERAVHQRVSEGGFHFSIFCGDRFLKREPEDEVKTRADRVLLEGFNKRSTTPHFHLIGNHDWVNRSKQWHTSESLTGFNGSLIVLDKPETRSVYNVGIHTLPSGFDMDMSKYSLDPNNLNIFIFHDMVMGCLLDDEGKVISETGINIHDIDRSEFDLVFGGDVHVPQRLNFKNTTGGYVGAVMQRTRADANQNRGWIEVSAMKGPDENWGFETEFVPVRGFFTKYVFEVDDNTNYEGLPLDDAYIKDTCCSVELVGSRSNVDRIANDARWNNYLEYYGVRSIELLRKYKVEQQEAVVDMSQSSSVVDDLGMYLESGFVDIGSLPKKKIYEIVESFKRS